MKIGDLVNVLKYDGVLVIIITE